MEYLDILKQYWGYSNFRGIQQDIIESIGKGHDTLGLMPTGGGKSITFQVPTMSMDGVCLVITPLIALMKDQVRNLKERGIKAAAIYTGMRREQIIAVMENCVYGDYKFLYISPERLSSELFLAKLRYIKICLITVDESHCISQWGYDFRPAYLKIAEIRNALPGVPVLALTATATPKVTDDIQDKLGFKEKNFFRMSFERENLSYVVRDTENKYEELKHILSKVAGSGIVYVRNRKETKDISDYLNSIGITSTFYHAGLDPEIKDQRQQEWTENYYRIVVATNAFGMGIDKPDVRVVIHIDMPDSIEAYFQEAGRAGRDGRRSYAILLHSPGDRRIINKRISDHFPEKDFIRKVYEKLSYYYQMAVGDGQGCTYGFSLVEFCQQILPVLTAFFHIVQTVFHIGGKFHIDDVIEPLQHEAGDHFAQGGGGQTLVYLIYILPVLDGGHDGSVGRGSAHALFLHGLDQGCLGIPGRRLGEMLLFFDLGGQGLVALLQIGQRRAYGFTLVIPAFLVNGDKAGEFHALMAGTEGVTGTFRSHNGFRKSVFRADTPQQPRSYQHQDRLLPGGKCGHIHILCRQGRDNGMMVADLLAVANLLGKNLLWDVAAKDSGGSGGI